MSFGILLFGFSCIPEEEILLETNHQLSPEVQQAKSWFEQNKEFLHPKSNSSHAQEFSLDLILPFFEKEPDWEDFYQYTFEDGRQVIEVHLKNLTGIMPSEFLEKYADQADDLTEESLLFIGNPHVEDGFVPVVVRYFSEGLKSEGMTYHQIPHGWSGMIDLFSYDERHLRSFKVENGQLTSHIRYQTMEAKIASIRRSGLISCDPGFWIDFPYSGILGGVQSTQSIWVVICTGGGGGSSGGGGSVAIPPMYADGQPTGGGGSGGTSSGYTGEDESNNFCRDNHCIPFPVEEIIKDPSFAGTKADCVYERLLVLSGGFKNAIQKFDGSFPVAHLKFEIDNSITLNTMKAFTRPPENYVIDIVLNGNPTKDASYQKRPNLLVAKTIIHEVIHAEMWRKILSVIDNGGNVDGMTRQQWIVKLSNGDYPGIFDYYTRYGVNGFQHPQMAAHYRNVLANILKEFDNNANTNQFYIDLAWEGLIYSNDPTWNKLSASERTRIQSTINNYLNQNQNEACN